MPEPVWKRSAALAAGLCAAMGLALAGCSSESKPEDAPSAATQAIEVQGALVRAEQLSLPVRASGTVAAMQTSTVTALVEGPVDRVFVRVGDRVSKGQPLLRIRQADYQRRASEAEAAVRLACTRLRLCEPTATPPMNSYTPSRHSTT